MTIAALIKNLQTYDPTIPVKVFCAFDTEGPYTWEDPHIEFDGQELHIEPGHG
jgi:hypothetical protein